MHRSFLKYHGQHLSSPRYHRHQAKYHYSNYLTNKEYIYICIYGHFTFLFEHVCPRRLATESYYLLANNFSPPSKSGVSIPEILDVPRSPTARRRAEA